MAQLVKEIISKFSYQAGLAAPLPLPLRTEEEVMSSWLTSDGPVVSIGCFTYNHVDYLEDAIRGFMGQVTTFPFEVIIRDDASTDGTTAIVKDYAERYPNIIRTIIEEKNQWVTGNVNNAIYDAMLSLAKGEYFALCEGDDYWICPTKLEQQVALLRANKQYTMCVAQTVMCKYKKGTLICSSLISGNDKLLQYFDEITQTYFHTSTFLMRLDILSTVIKKYRSNILICDSAIRLMLVHYGPLVFLREVVSVWRVTEKGAWNKLNKYKQIVWEIELAESLYKFFEPEYRGYFGLSLYGFYRYIIGQDVRQFSFGRLSVNLPRFFYFAGRYGLPNIFVRFLRRGLRGLKKIIRQLT